MIHTENDQNYHAFPSIETLTTISEDTLRKHNFGYRAKYIVSSARTIEKNGGEEWIESASKKDYENCLADIVGLMGIGRKVADCILLHSMGFRAAVPLDVHVIRIANRLVFSLSIAQI